MNYGLPYKGSKNKIATSLIRAIPSAGTFVDLFAGGCAMTHAAMTSGRYKHFIANDISDAPSLFLDAVAGKYRNERRWISSEDFFARKDTDPYIRICWSFGNTQDSYIYGRHIEPWKKALHYARVWNDCRLFREMGIPTDGSREDIMRHYEAYKRRYIAWYKGAKEVDISLKSLQSLQSLQSLERLERLERLQRLRERLTILQGDYRAVDIPKDAVVYADPPYANTSGYLNEFDNAEFWQWVRTRDFPVYVSEYTAPSDFVAVWKKSKACKAAASCSVKTIEKLYVHNKWINNNK